jgi:hypothetical protein
MINSAFQKTCKEIALYKMKVSDLIKTTLVMTPHKRSIVMEGRLVIHAALLACIFCFTLATVRADSVTLQNGTATFSQSTDPIFGMHSPDYVYDGLFDYPNGWAIAQFYPGIGSTSSETAVWETATNVNTDSLAFRMYFTYLGGGHLLGRFRFSVTTDDRSTFADGSDNGGDVTANWIILGNPIVQGPGGMTFITLPDNSVLAGGTFALDGIYTVIYPNTVSNITGIRLEALEDPSLPDSGPGTAAPDIGNFVLSELKLDTVTLETIDIRPGSAPNNINLGSGGTVPVAIISTTTFDARTVDPTTVVLAGARVRLRGQGTPMASFEDVNHDGLVDIVVHVSTEAFQLSESDTQAILTGWTFGGVLIQGVDSIRVVP